MVVHRAYIWLPFISFNGWVHAENCRIRTEGRMEPASSANKKEEEIRDLLLLLIIAGDFFSKTKI